jgi:hypothetical protein
MMRFLAEFWAYIRAGRKFWLVPLLVVMLAVAALLVLAQTSAIAPFIYSIF